MLLVLLLFGGGAFFVRYKFVGQRLSFIWAFLSAIFVWVGGVVLMWWSSFAADTVTTGILGRSIWYGLFTAVAVYFILRRKSGEEESSA